MQSLADPDTSVYGNIARAWVYLFAKMASYAPSTITSREKKVELQQVVEDNTEPEGVHLLPHDVTYQRALLALALFFPTGIFALIFTFLTTLQSSRKNMEGAYKSSQRAETCTLLSYRVGVVVLLVLGALVIAGITIIICNTIDTIHLARRF